LKILEESQEVVLRAHESDAVEDVEKKGRKSAPVYVVGKEERGDFCYLRHGEAGTGEKVEGVLFVKDRAGVGGVMNDSRDVRVVR
jgi:hypothetical protein